MRLAVQVQSESRPTGLARRPGVTEARRDAAGGRSPPGRRVSLQSQTDARLTALVRLGDEAAFEAIVERYRPLLLSHCRRIVGDTRAQDAVQQALLSAWGALRGGCEVRELRPWLFTIARRAAFQLLREQRERSDALPDSLIGDRSAADHAEQSASLRETLAAIAALPRSEREALMATAVHGRSARDTARTLGVSETAVRQLVFRARANARAAVHVFAPPVFLGRLAALARRIGAYGRGVCGGCSAQTSAALVKVAALVAGGILLATPVAVVRLTHGHTARSASALSVRASFVTSGRAAASGSDGARGALALRTSRQELASASAAAARGALATGPATSRTERGVLASSSAAGRSSDAGAAPLTHGGSEGRHGSPIPDSRRPLAAVVERMPSGLARPLAAGVSEAVPAAVAAPVGAAASSAEKVLEAATQPVSSVAGSVEQTTHSVGEALPPLPVVGKPTLP